VGEQPGVPFYRPGSRDVLLIACLLPMASLWSDAWVVRRVASRCFACKWTVPNLTWWSVPNFVWWSVPNFYACMSYLYVCMCGCTTGICLYACMVNGKCGWLSAYVLTLLYLLLLAIATREGESREKWEVGPAVVEACELPQPAREGLGTGALRR
jgi:hypothetical protein